MRWSRRIRHNIRGWLSHAIERDLGYELADSRFPAASPRNGMDSRGDEFTKVNFWDSLNLAERRAFASVAHERTFACGARLMREGEQADHVMLILSGWTRISVQENGGERVIAERGPGQLVGERGALRVNVRSATVIALETVHALVTKTEDFASFVSAHPRVLEVVENQIYDRLTEEPIDYGWNDRPNAFPLERGHHPSPESLPLPPSPSPPPPPLLSGENCTVLLTDVVGFGARTRNDLDRMVIRRESLDMIQASLGPLWEKCIYEDRGDGLLIVAPPTIPTTRVMERLHRELPYRLKMHNRTYGEPVHIQLRAAVEVGPVTGDPLGISGEAIISASRLLDCPVLKEGMASTGATLGMIVSTFVYETAIRHAGGWTDPEEYGLVEVNVKESRVHAWIQLIDPAASVPALRGPLSSGLG